MNEVTLPPSPNWYLSTVLACAEDGTVAWGARYTIVVARAKSDVKILKYSIIDDAHSGKVTSLAFSPKFGQTNHNLLVSGGDEHVVRIWNLDTNAAIMAHTYSDNRQIVVGVDWSKADPNLVFCVSSDGLLVTWNLTQNVSQPSLLGKLGVTSCLSSCPHDSNIVALGTKNGLVYIINVNGNGKIVYKLRGHDTEITSLSWCPSETNVLHNGEAKDMLLASGAKDRSVFIWRAGGDGRYEVHLQLPINPLDSRHHKSKLSIATGNWTSLCWPEPRLLLVSSVWGELLSFHLSTNEKPKPTLIHATHARGLFCIACITNRGESGDRNWRSETAGSLDVWTSAQDRLVVCSRLERNVSKILYHIPTQGGFVYSIAASPLDTTRLAFGVGDAMLRLWNLCEPHENTFDVTTLWQKIKGKVMTIAWHPEKENLLAFGTCEGRVGLFDTNSNKPPTLFRQYHRHSVYCLGWGPELIGKHYVLYSCGGGELVSFIPEKPNEMPKSIVKKDCTEFSWKPDFSCLAVGYENGLISFLNRKLKECGRSIYTLKKPVQRIAWHPESTSTDLHLSPLQHQMAVATNAVAITIFDVMNSTSAVTESENNEDNDDTNVRDGTEICAAITCRVVGTLNGHSARVVDLTWNPHISGYLASASFDQTVRVWKTETQQLVCTYTGHRGPVYSCMWSPLDPDLIITGGCDFTLRVWRVSEQSLTPLEVIPKPKAKRARTKKNKSTIDRASPTRQPNDEHTLSSQLLVKVDDSIGNANINEFSMTEQEIRESTVKDAKKKRSKNPTYFRTTARASNDRWAMLRTVEELFKNAPITSMDDCGREFPVPDLSADPTIDNQDRESAVPSLFGSKRDIIKVLETEKLAHVAVGQYQTATELDLWCNNLKQNLLDAAKEKRLNDTLLSLAPSLSTRFWQEMCEAYAAQLKCEGNHRKAVSYLLCIHKINQAIQVFVEGKMYREAYVLANCKLDANDPIIDNLLAEWAASAAKDGNYEDAVQCHIKLRNYDEAVKYLCRRGDGVSLEIAARLALLSGDEESCKTLSQRAVNEALSRSDYTSAENIVKKFPQIQFCEVIIFATKNIEEAFEKCNDDYIWKWLKEGNSCSTLLNLAERYPDSDRYYHDISGGADISRSEIASMLWLNVGTQLALATACSKDREKYKHLVTASSLIYEDETARSRNDDGPVRAQDFLIKFLATLDGTSPFSINSIFANNDVAASISLRAYLCQGVLYWLPRFNATDLETNERITLVRSFIMSTIKDLLNDRSFAYTTLSNRFEKLERELADAIGKSQKYNDDDDDIDLNATVASLSHRLGECRAEKNKFLEERVAAPCPVSAFDNACQLTRSLFRGDTEKELSELVYSAWMNAVKMPA